MFAALAGILEQTLLLGLGLLRILAPDNKAQDRRRRWRRPRHAFVDTNLHLAFLLLLSGERGKQIKGLAIRLQQGATSSSRSAR